MLGRTSSNSISFRFFRIIAVMLLIGTILLSVLISGHEYQNSMRELEDSGRRLAIFIARLSTEPLIAQNYVALDAIVNEADSDSEQIAYILVYNGQGTLLTTKYASLNYRVPRFNSIFTALPKDMDLTGIVKVLKTEHHIMEVALPVEIDTAHLGTVVVGLSKHTALSEIEKSVLLIVSINVLMAALLLYALIIVFRKTLFDPLTALIESNLKLAQGDPTVRVNSTVKGELKLLVDSFNHMAACLEENEQQLRVIFDTSKAGIIMVNELGCIVLANQSMSDMFGYSLQELLSSAYHKLVSADNYESSDSNIQSLVGGDLEQISCERNYVRKDGTYFQGFASARRHTDAEGRLISIVLIIADITDQKRVEYERLDLERQLLHTQKLKSLGVLAGGIAHDFNNLLTVIIGNLDLALRRLPPDSTATTGIRKAVRASNKAADLTRQMLAYSGKGIVTLRQIDLGNIVRENVDLFKTTVPKTITFTINLAADLPSVTVDPGQIQQVVMNLITNASEAIGDIPGVITLSTGVREFTEEELAKNRLEEKQVAGRYVYLDVSDSGSGMDAETEQRLFEPFYSTKFTGRGLGMSAVLGIIRSHHGAIILHSEPGRGSQFTILLPAGNDGATETDAHGHLPETDALSPFLTGTVLVVDDEDDVRDFCVQCVTHFGFSALSACDGLEAVEIFRTRHREIQLVILDMTMPIMDGGATFRELRRINPAVRIIISTGHSTHDTTMSFSGDKPDAFIQKPFQVRELREKILQLMQGT